MSNFQSGEFFQELYEDPATGFRYDSLGNPVSRPGSSPQNYGANLPAYYTATGQALRYADVYPGPVNVHQNQALADFAVRFELDSGLFISPEVAPIFTVDKRSDIFYKIRSQGSDVIRTPTDNTDVRAVGAMANEVESGFDTDTYTSIWHSVRDFVPDKVAANADQALQLMSSTTEFLTQFIEYRRDARLLGSILTTTNFTNTVSYTTAGGGQITAGTAALRYNNIAFNYAKAKMIQNNLMRGPSHVVMPSVAAQALAASVEVAAQVVYGLGASYVVNNGWGGQNFGLPSPIYGIKPVVAPHTQNTAKKGQAFSVSDILTDNLIFLNVQAPSARTMNAVTTFRVGGLTVKSYRDDPREGTWIEVGIDEVMKVTNAQAGYVLTDALP